MLGNLEEAGRPSLRIGVWQGMKTRSKINDSVRLHAGRPLTSALLAVGSPKEQADLAYLTGLFVTDPIVALRQRTTCSVVVSLLDRELARAADPALRIYTPETLPVPRALQGTLAGWTAGLLRARGVRTAMVPRNFPLAVADRLRRLGIRLQVSAGPLLPERAVKAPSELARIADSQRAAVAAMRAAVRLIGRARVGPNGVLRAGRRRLTADRVRAEIERVLAARRCAGADTIVAGGRQSAMPHAAGRGALRARQPIVLDIFPRHRGHGYWGDLSRTVVKGAPSAALRRMHAAVKAAQAAAIAEIRAGVSGKRVHRAAAAVLEERGFRTGILDGRAQGFIHSTGHGLGLEVHEAPSLSARGGRLRVGHVVTVEPGLYYFRHGGVRIEDLVVVTRRGCRRVVRCPDYFCL